MTRLPILLAGSALTLGLTVTAAHAVVTIEPSADVAVSLTVDLVGTTLTVTSGGPALTHDDPTNCSGGGTSSVVCTMVGETHVAGRSKADTFTISIDAPSNTYRLIVTGRRGDDHFDVVQADGGWLTLEGKRDTNSYAIGSSGSPLAVAAETNMEIYGNQRGAAASGEVFDLHVDNEGDIYVQGTAKEDTFDISGTIDATTTNTARLDVRGLKAKDTFELAVTSVSKTYSGAALSTLNLEGGDGDDDFNLNTDLDATDATITVKGDDGDDDLHLGGNDLHADGSTMTFNGNADANLLTDDTGAQTTANGGTISILNWP